MSTVRPKSLVRFGVFEFDPETGDLWKAGHHQRLQDRQREVLWALIEGSGQLISRNAIQRRLWTEGTFVDAETGLNVIVNRLRQSLGDVAGSPRFIETLPRKGYRFIAPVQLVPSAEFAVAGPAAAVLHDRGRRLRPDDVERHDGLPSSTPLQKPSRRRLWLGAGALALAAAGAALFAVRVSTVDESPGGLDGAVFAVMPLANLLGDSASDYMVDGLTDSLITDLAEPAPFA